MKTYIFILVSLLAYKTISSLPVDKRSNLPNENAKVEEEIDNLGLEYGRYLQEVFMALKNDKHFSEKLQNISSEDIKSGKIAGELDFVHHNIRTKLDELKRIELDRLRKLVKQENELNERGSYSDGRRWRTVSIGSKNNLKDSLGRDILRYGHLDPKSEHQFTKEDLHKLIIKASTDLEELDKKRREEFKMYEMEKEFQYQESLKNMTVEQKEEAIKKHDEKVKKHKEHPRVHHPGSKQQFQEVWEEQDHMPKEEFKPQTFFALHDINGDGFLDQEEVESLLATEIKKLYDPNNPEDDPNEMQEEYHRMREHIYKEADKNRDGLISRKEFLDLTQNPEFEKDESWKTLDEQQVYTQDELKEYEKHRQEALAHQYAYYVQPQYYHPQMMPGQQYGLPYDHPAAQQVQFVPVQHPGAQMQHPGVQMQHPGAQMQHPGVQMQHPGAQMQHPGVQIQHPGVQMQHPGVQMQHPGVAPQVNQQHPQLGNQQINTAYQNPSQINTQNVQHPSPAGNVVQPPPVGYQQVPQQVPQQQQYASNIQTNQQQPQQYSGQANYQQQSVQQQANSQPKH